MLAIRTILHATDFSERSDYAFRLACSLARDYGARLIVLHVITVPAVVYGEAVVPPDPEEYYALGQEQLDRLQVPDASVRAERRLVEGDVAPTILRVAQEVNADLIVLGTHGRTGVRRLLMGSVAEEVMRQAACPVLTVKTPFPKPALASPLTVAEAVPA